MKIILEAIFTLLAVWLIILATGCRSQVDELSINESPKVCPEIVKPQIAPATTWDKAKDGGKHIISQTKPLTPVEKARVKIFMMLLVGFGVVVITIIRIVWSVIRYYIRL
jgi:hypothetical protein